MNTRKKGRKFEKIEAKAWVTLGWEVELVRPEARFIGPGRVVTAYRDFFGGRYDFIAVHKEARMAVLAQVSTEPPSSHRDPGPMGLRSLFPLLVEDIMMGEVAESGVYAGVYEVYVRYVKSGRKWEPRRTWWA